MWIVGSTPCVNEEPFQGCCVNRDLCCAPCWYGLLYMYGEVVICYVLLFPAWSPCPSRKYRANALPHIPLPYVLTSPTPLTIQVISRTTSPRVHLTPSPDNTSHRPSSLLPPHVFTSHPLPSHVALGFCCLWSTTPMPFWGWSFSPVESFQGAGEYRVS